MTKGAAAPTEQNKQKGGSKMNNSYQEQILSHMLNLMKELLEKMIKQEREIYLQQHNDTKVNGYYTRDLYTPKGSAEKIQGEMGKEIPEGSEVVGREGRGAIGIYGISGRDKKDDIYDESDRKGI